MQPEHARRLFDLKGLLLLREEVSEQLAKDLGVPAIVWNSENISVLKEKIIDAAPKEFNTISPRSMHENINAPITDKTEIPHAKNNRLDLMCIYLGYDSFNDYKIKKGNAIEAIALSTNTTYGISKNNQQKKQEETTYMISYYYNYFSSVDRGILRLDHYTGRAILNLLSPTPYSPLTVDYVGSFETTPFGYLNIFGRVLQFEYDITIYTRIYYDDHRKGYKYYTGIYTATSIQDYACFGGVGLLEKVNCYEEALQKAEAPVDQQIFNYLKDKRFNTPRKAFFSLDELAILG